MNKNTDRFIGGSFRDPSGFVFVSSGVIYRQINQSYRENYERLMSSGLYDALVSAGLMIAHCDAPLAPPRPDVAFKIIRPDRVPFISFPYEWSFSQLKAAARATLRIQAMALDHGLTLKDASAYNIQFMDGRPVLIDTLSFETYREGEAWVAYRQFCQHFLAPLALMALVDVRLGLLLRDFIDGIPLDLAARLLPTRSKLNLSLLMHLHLHAKSQARYSDSRPDGQAQARKTEAATRKMSRQAISALVASLLAATDRLEWNPKGTEWGDYYDDTNYSTESMQHKQALILEFLAQSAPNSLWDLGGNTGVFSRLASRQGVHTVSFDIDPAAVEKNYRNCVANEDKQLLPLILDLTNPSPAIGWHNEERDSLRDRGPVDMVMALALIHHLAISNNIPLERLARFFSDICTTLVIEFVPKADSQVLRLLASRPDIFPEYTKDGFEAAFAPFFSIVQARQIEGSQRILYLMNKA